MRGSYQSYLFCYLEWLSPEVQSEVQQERERKKKSGDLCVRGHRGINFLTKLSPTIKPKSMPKSPKRDLKNNIFTRQHSHPFNIFFPPQRTGRQLKYNDERKTECLRIFIWALLSRIISRNIFFPFNLYILWDLLQNLTLNSNRSTHSRTAQNSSALVATKHQ